MERQDLSYGKVVSTRGLRVQALLGGTNSPTSRSPEASTGLCVYGLQGCEPFTLRRGVAYIESARPLRPSVMRGLKYIKAWRYW